jgi:DNA modification methylase
LFDENSAQIVDNVILRVGDCIDVMRSLPENHFHTCITSPPYFRLRDYGIAGQIGLEQTPEMFVGRLVEVFREVKRVLREDGTLWLNLGDSFATSGCGVAAKNLLGIPWRVAFALQADGWHLRQDIVWSKPAPMPESVSDRCTRSHEMIFMFAKSPSYYYDAEAIKEPSVMKPQRRNTKRCDHPKGDAGRAAHRRPEGGSTYETRNKRSVWTVASKPYKGAHFATFPPDLIRPCIQAGCPENGFVLDPFGGSGTTGLVARECQRRATLIELNPVYAELARQRLGLEQDAPDESDF